MRLLGRCCRTIVCCVCGHWAVLGAESGIPVDVESLWRGVDVRSLPLDQAILSEKKDAGITTRKVMFTAQVREGFAVRILGFYSFPSTGGKHAAILHIHGGGQTATRDYTEYFARRGYATLSIDWAGNPLPGDGGKSDWGPFAVAQSDDGRVFNVRPSPRDNPWFHWAIACRRALTFLERQPEVDAQRLGVFGISMGGRLTWVIAGIDERVKAAVSIYGAVRVADRIADIPGSEQVGFSTVDAEVWRNTLDSAAYAPRIRAPFLYLSAANDFYGAMDLADGVLATVPGDHRQAFTPHFNHHVEPEQSQDLLLWFERCLRDGPVWPRTPELQAARASADHAPRVTFVPERAEEVTNVAVYFSVDPVPQSRFWRMAKIERSGDTWSATLPAKVDEGGKIFAYGNVTYRSGISLSSRVLALAPTTNPGLGKRTADEPKRVIDDFSRGAIDWFVPEVGVNPLLREQTWFRNVAGTNGEHAVQCEPVPGRAWRMATRKVGDPEWRGATADGIEIRIRAEHANTLVVVATENERRRPYPTRIYVAHAPMIGGGVWENIEVPLAAFREATSGASLSSWSEVNLLALQGDFLARTGKNATIAGVAAGPWQDASPTIAWVKWREQRRSADISAGAAK